MTSIAASTTRAPVIPAGECEHGTHHEPTPATVEVSHDQLAEHRLGIVRTAVCDDCAVELLLYKLRIDDGSFHVEVEAVLIGSAERGDRLAARAREIDRAECRAVASGRRG